MYVYLFAEADRNRFKPRKTNENNSEKTKTNGPLEKSKANDGGDVKKEKKDGDIKVKTLEEILREKALKNLHERTAQKKRALAEADQTGKDHVDGDEDQPILKSVVSVSKDCHISQKTLEPHECNEPVADRNTKPIHEKKVQLRTAKAIIKSIIDPDNVDTRNATSISISTMKSDNNKPDDVQSSQKEIPSDEPTTSKAATATLTDIKVKTFEEIMQEKHQRNAKVTKEAYVEEQDVKSTTAESKPDSSAVVEKQLSRNRKIRIVKKSEEAKPIVVQCGGKLLQRRIMGSTVNTKQGKCKC